MNKIFDLISILRDASHLNVFDANFSFSSEKMNRLSGTRDRGALPRRRGLFRVVAFCCKWGQAFFPRKHLERGVQKGSILAAYVTNNQYLALKPVVDKIPEASLVEIRGDPALSPDSFLCRTVSALFFFHALWNVVWATPYQRKAMAYFFDVYWNCYGFYVQSRLYYRFYKPKALLVSNDHSVLPRTLMLAARDAGVPTIYMQHAAVTSMFPPLLFDYAFLEGRVSLMQYLQAGETSSQIYLAGIPKMDFSAEKVRQRGKVEALGVAINASDNFSHARALLQKLNARYAGKEIFFRPHPALARSFDEMKGFCEQEQIVFSNPVEETAGEYLSKLDVLIAGTSSIHLEATLQNILSLYFPLGENRNDAYGFLEFGMVDKCETIEELIEKIDCAEVSYPNVRCRAKAFCATVDTRYDGQSSELIAKTLLNIFRKEDSVMPNMVWAVSNERSHAYELREDVV